MPRIRTFWGIVLLCLAAEAATAAPRVHLFLQIDGNDIQGDSTVTSLEREGSIECLAWTDSLTTSRETGTVVLTVGRRLYGPVTCTKRIDKASPLMFMALTQNDPVTRAEFRFYRPIPSRTRTARRGGEEHYYTVVLENSYVSKITTTSTDIATNPDARNVPATETVSFVFADVTRTYEINGATHTDSWSGD